MVPGGGLGETRGLLRGQAEEEEIARSGLVFNYIACSSFAFDAILLVLLKMFNVINIDFGILE